MSSRDGRKQHPCQNDSKRYFRHFESFYHCPHKEERAYIARDSVSCNEIKDTQTLAYLRHGGSQKQHAGKQPGDAPRAAPQN